MRILCILLIFISTQLFSQPNNCKIFDQATVDLFRQNQLLNTGGDYDLKYHRCEWTVDPAVQGINGVVTTYFVALSTMNAIEFDFANVMTVDSVSYHGTTLSFTHTNDIVQAQFANSISATTLDSVSVFYHGIPFSTGFGSFTYSSHSGIPILSTLSEPYGARDWWPCKQSLYDKVDSADILITCPSQNLAGSNGKLISVTPAGGNNIHHWQVRYPMVPYLFALAVTEYAQYHNTLPLVGGDTLDILNYVYRSDSAIAVTQTPDILDIISLYDSLFIEYPFKREKYGHAQWNWGGGEEHQTMSFMSDFNFELMAHECAHQWFGDYITCGSWEDVWLNEGFATYLAALCDQYIRGNVFWNNWKSGTRADITNISDGSVLCTDTTQINRLFDYRLTYEKGAFLNHMLRWELGDSLYFAGIRAYLNDSALKYGFARTPDLKNNLENVSGLNLTTFFDQWYYNEGHPSYQVEWNYSNGNLIVQINQTQSHPSVGFFEMHVPIEFSDLGVDTTFVFNNTFSGQIFIAPLGIVPTTTQFDPEIWLLSANNSVTFNGNLTDINVISNLGVSVYPNPVRENLIIQSEKDLGDVSIEVRDQIGKIVFADNVHLQTGNNQIDISEIKSGVYSLVINSKNKREVVKICKMQN